ncbi:ABC transporter ATP-binding protein (plasmid) [Pedobacter sp. BS3]|uniref:ABC transporter ATP-binding protein n=1 Tax=Pedobacter sp. BS3 TaxID=2567937 RepID=UPI0011EEE220|nr:ABC transporter ATP-binding protein [Pedobacter sp. BS3]TZF86193.1 ABC transporter ATP-binding protein [Pedobacter sp. BS3]
MSIAIKAENLSKAYQLGEIGTGTISRDLERWWAKVRGKEDPFLKIGETNDRSTKGNSDVVWSLKDINFEIEQGDAVGIIGRNGAGKSTLLKILSRVTSPTTGSVKIKGRVASLLEVGTGFHPELTGRENIFLNGAILGMRKKEIKRRLDEIVDFAGVERYLDTPVKRYSSGMYVRLAFAVAAHLESEILIVDEVLAVGDAEFQKKCLGKMGDVSKGEGRTVLFVSHNMGSIRHLCSNAIYLKNGMISGYGETDKIIFQYINADPIDNSIENFSHIPRADKNYGKEFSFEHCQTLSKLSDVSNSFLYGEELSFKIKAYAKSPLEKMNIGFRIEDDMGISLTGPRSMDHGIGFDIDGYKDIEIEFPGFNLAPGRYFITLTGIYRGVCLDQVEKCIAFDVRHELANRTIRPHSGAWGKIITQPRWKS